MQKACSHTYNSMKIKPYKSKSSRYKLSYSTIKDLTKEKKEGTSSFNIDYWTTIFTFKISKT